MIMRGSIPQRANLKILKTSFEKEIHPLIILKILLQLITTCFGAYRIILIDDLLEIYCETGEQLERLIKMEHLLIDKFELSMKFNILF